MFLEVFDIFCPTETTVGPDPFQNMDPNLHPNLSFWVSRILGHFDIATRCIKLDKTS